jgi:hypothetical protein
MAEQGVVLEHEATGARATLADGVLAMEVHAAGVRALEAGHDAQQRGLAGAGRSQQGQQLARLHLERQAVEGEVVAEALADVEDLDAHGDILCAHGANVRVHNNGSLRERCAAKQGEQSHLPASEINGDCQRPAPGTSGGRRRFRRQIAIRGRTSRQA